MARVRIWDLPTRVFHWALVLCVLTLVVTGQVGGDAMAWHFRAGYTVLALLLFRLVWGLVGGHWSRFGVFVRTPATILRYLRGQGTPDMEVGHNPLGALSVLALLGASLLQVASGLCSDDEIVNAGPLVRWLPSDWVSVATWLHTRVNKYALLLLVLLHVGAIVYYRLAKQHNLVRPMLTGDKDLDVAVPPSRDSGVTRVAALLLFALLLLGVWQVIARLEAA